MIDNLNFGSRIISNFTIAEQDEEDSKQIFTINYQLFKSSVMYEDGTAFAEIFSLLISKITNNTVVFSIILTDISRYEKDALYIFDKIYKNKISPEIVFDFFEEIYDDYLSNKFK